MATLGLGVDVVEVPRFALALSRRARMAPRLFTEAERRDAKEAPERLAARFAGKEAVMKSLGVGLGLPFHAIEVRKHASGAPYVALHAEAADLAASRGVTAFHLSLTHTDQTAIAVVIATDEGPRAG